MQLSLILPATCAGVRLQRFQCEVDHCAWRLGQRRRVRALAAIESCSQLLPVAQPAWPAPAPRFPCWWLHWLLQVLHFERLLMVSVFLSALRRNQGNHSLSAGRAPPRRRPSTLRWSTSSPPRTRSRSSRTARTRATLAWATRSPRGRQTGSWSLAESRAPLPPNRRLPSWTISGTSVRMRASA